MLQPNPTSSSSPQYVLNPFSVVVHLILRRSVKSKNDEVNNNQFDRLQNYLKDVPMKTEEH